MFTYNIPMAPSYLQLMGVCFLHEERGKATLSGMKQKVDTACNPSLTPGAFLLCFT